MVENKDLKIIRKKYGEKMYHYARKTFPNILEEEGVLSSLYLKHFEPSHDLYKDLIESNRLLDFEEFINSKVYKAEKNSTSIKNPFELMKEAGYTLYECKSEKDIQKFKKYYEKREELCTFKGGRLNKCYVFFAVKDNAEKLNRKDFIIPNREDEYGTSVISIQFDKNSLHTLSIKNRYNHKVKNPDCTFQNNLENIIPTLTDSFEKYMNFEIAIKRVFDVPNYIMTADEKLYKYNFEEDNIYYCPNNIIIDGHKVKKYDKEKFIVINSIVIDLENKKIWDYNDDQDVFSASIGEIEKIKIIKENTLKIIILNIKDKDSIKLVIDENSNLIAMRNPNIIESPNCYLLGKSFNDIKYLDLPYLKIANKYFGRHLNKLETIKADNLVEAKDCFLEFSRNVKKIYLPNLRITGKNFMTYSQVYNASFPSLIKTGTNFMSHVHTLVEIDIRNLKRIEDYSLCNCKIETLILDECESIGNSCLNFDYSLKELYAPKLTKIEKTSFINSDNIKKLYLPNIEQVNSIYWSKWNKILKNNGRKEKIKKLIKKI